MINELCLYDLRSVVLFLNFSVVLNISVVMPNNYVTDFIDSEQTCMTPMNSRSLNITQPFQYCIDGFIHAIDKRSYSRYCQPDIEPVNYRLETRDYFV